jgi:hypothetical protein
MITICAKENQNHLQFFRRQATCPVTKIYFKRRLVAGPTSADVGSKSMLLCSITS